MKKRIIALGIGIGIGLSPVVLTFFAPQTAPVTQASLPRCQEDAVLVGVGSFTQGKWTTYVCGPSFDDYTVVTK